MTIKTWPGRSASALFIISAIWLTSIPANAQDLVAISSLGGQSVFVFRSAAKSSIRRIVSVTKPVRSKAQRQETVAKIKKQYETQAKTAVRINHAQTVDPASKPPKTLTGPEGSKRLAGVGEYYLSKGDIEHAIESFRDAKGLDETNVTASTGLSEALALKGNDLLVKDKADEAKALFLEAIKLDPKNSVAYFGLGDVYVGLNQQADAIKNYEDSLRNNPNLTEIFVPLGVLYFQTGEIAKADDLLTKALATNANNSETQFFLGLVRASQNKNEDALTAFAKAKSLDANNAEIYHNTGEVLTRLKRQTEAIPEYQKAVIIKPGYFEAWLGLGDALSALGKYPDAVAAYTTASKLKNDSWEALAGLAEAYRQTGKFEDAEAKFKLATVFLARVKDYNKDILAELYSKAGISVFQKCEVLRDIGCDWKLAIADFQKSVDISNNPIDYVNLGAAYFRLGHDEFNSKNIAAATPDLQAARVALEKAIAGGQPAAGYASQNLASVYIDLGDRKNAIEVLKGVIQMHPDVAYNKYQIGVAYKLENDLANAEKWFRAAADGEPANAVYLAALGETLIAQKKGKELKKVIDRLRPLDPNAAAAFEARAKILKISL